MQELYEKIEWLKNEIDQYLTSMIGWQTPDFTGVFSMLSRRFGEVFPEIIGSYEYYEMSDRYDDRVFWVSQHQRILDALRREDVFLLYDVLLMETRQNLEAYQQVLVYKGLAYNSVG